VNERVSSEELAKWLAVHREREEGRDCDCWDCEKSRDLLDARAEIVVATKELTRLSVEIVRAERERDEARKALRLLASEVDAGRRDCQCGDLNCQHVAMTDGLLAAIYECCVAARTAAKGKGGGDG